jgi:hypothetical protein
MKVSSAFLAAIVVVTTQLSSTLAALTAVDDAVATAVNQQILVKILLNDLNDAGEEINPNVIDYSTLVFAADDTPGASFSTGDGINFQNPFAVTGGDIVSAIITPNSNSLGSVRFLPTRDFIGVASFVYRFNDVGGATNLATVTITVTPSSSGTYLAWLE